MDFIEVREKKPAIIATICKEQVDQAVKYLEDNYAPTQAALLRSEFLKIVRLLEVMPSLGTPYKNKMVLVFSTLPSWFLKTLKLNKKFL